MMRPRLCSTVRPRNSWPGALEPVLVALLSLSCAASASPSRPLPLCISMSSTAQLSPPCGD